MSLEVMSASLDRALMAMSLEVEDEPFDLPNLPEFCSSEKNRISLVGRLLNPDRQNMESLIIDMPKKWGLYDRVRGVALTRERFQFIFQHERDLEVILGKGVQSYSQWSLAIEKWVESPPVDYLQFIEVWVQLRHIPINHYTEAAITALGEFAGQVISIAFDPVKPQEKDYVRVKVKFDVSKPLRRSKKVNLPMGGSVNILYDYEQIQKRCYTCQRITHEQERCPIFRQLGIAQSSEGSKGVKNQKQVLPVVLKESDPLFGILSESQVGVNPMTGRPRIAAEVLKGMRHYILVANGPERIARECRLKSTLAELDKDPLAQKSMLRLEPLPSISYNVDKGKGRVFDFEQRDLLYKQELHTSSESKLLASAISSGRSLNLHARLSSTQSDSGVAHPMDSESFNQQGPTVFRTGLLEASSSGTKQKTSKPRNRPQKNVRKARVLNASMDPGEKERILAIERVMAEKKKGCG